MHSGRDLHGGGPVCLWPCCWLLCLHVRWPHGCTWPLWTQTSQKLWSAKGSWSHLSPESTASSALKTMKTTNAIQGAPLRRAAVQSQTAWWRERRLRHSGGWLKGGWHWLGQREEPPYWTCTLEPCQWENSLSTYTGILGIKSGMYSHGRISVFTEMCVGESRKLLLRRLVWTQLWCTSPSPPSSPGSTAQQPRPNTTSTGTRTLIRWLMDLLTTPLCCTCLTTALTSPEADLSSWTRMATGLWNHGQGESLSSLLAQRTSTAWRR